MRKNKIKKSVNFKEMTWIRIHFFPVWIQDTDPHQIKLIPSTALMEYMRNYK